jgi:hypothetical protein
MGTEPRPNYSPVVKSERSMTSIWGEHSAPVVAPNDYQTTTRQGWACQTRVAGSQNLWPGAGEEHGGNGKQTSGGGY